MATMFVRRPGTVVTVPTGGQTGNILMIGGISSGLLSSMGSIVTGFGLETESGVQVLHALQRAVFIHSFGERLGSLVVSGVAPSMQCSSMQSGISSILGYYDQTRISASGKAYPIVIGYSRFMGFVRGIRLGMSNPELQLGEFALRLSVFKE